MANRRRRKVFNELIYNGDWHTRLLDALKLADETARSPRVREAVARLREVLDQEDECVHTVAVRQPVPPAWNAHSLVQQLKNGSCADARVSVEEPGIIALTFTRRGSMEWVERTVKDDVACAMSFAIWLSSRSADGRLPLVAATERVPR